jgi:hypothetical protein
VHIAKSQCNTIYFVNTVRQFERQRRKLSSGETVGFTLVNIIHKLARRFTMLRVASLPSTAAAMKVEGVTLSPPIESPRALTRTSCWRGTGTP